jgi:tetratricopeptide (TPR) repeat protein
MAIALAPTLFFLALEFGLRLVGFGEPASFFLKIPGADAYTTNQNFVYRFFPRELAIRPAPLYLPAEKPPAGYRIFVLGGSAVLGDFASEFSVARMLQVMLRSRYPGVEFEVVNAAVAAVDSNIVLQVAREAAGHDPDLFVVYLGNNEVVGPFGPDSIGNSLVGRDRPPSLLEIRAGLWLRTTRVGQLIQRVVAPDRKGKPARRQRGGADLLRTLVRVNDPRLEATYRRFERNLEDLLEVASDAGAKTVVATVASNLRDFSPFASLHPVDMTREGRALFASAYRNGLALARRGEWTAALRRFEGAARIDSGFAQLQFEMGRCLLGAGRLPEARESLVRARDLDAGRYRADSVINRIIRGAAEGRESEGIHLADAERSLADGEFSGDGLPGDELFYDHVHLTFEGSYALARSILDQVEPVLPEWIRSRTSAPPDDPSPDRVAQALALTEWDLAPGPWRAPPRGRGQPRDRSSRRGRWGGRSRVSGSRPRSIAGRSSWTPQICPCAETWRRCCWSWGTPPGPRSSFASWWRGCPGSRNGARPTARRWHCRDGWTRRSSSSERRWGWIRAISSPAPCSAMRWKSEASWARRWPATSGSCSSSPTRPRCT